jgi:hypothetical protein
VEKLKETTSRQQALIDSLQQENQNASSTISLKASELDPSAMTLVLLQTNSFHPVLYD